MPSWPGARPAAVLFTTFCIAVPASAVHAADGGRPESQVRKGVPYATTSPRQTLDLYLPASRGVRPSPLVILIHGGAFRTGSSRQIAPLARPLVQRGFAVAAVNYRLSGDARYPAGARDVKAAVRWLRANALEYDLDPLRFTAWGRSAGGWMATMLGVTGDQATIFDDPSLGNPRVSSAVQAVVTWYAPSNFRSIEPQLRRMRGCRYGKTGAHSPQYRAASRWLGGNLTRSALAPSANLTRYPRRAQALPRWFIAHGDADCTVPEAQSRELFRALVWEGAKVSYLMLRGARHRDPAFAPMLMRRSIAFVRGVR